MSHRDFPIHVLICTYGPVRALRRTLQSLGQVRRPPGFEQFWVVENGSDAGARRICRSMEHALPLRYHHLPKPGKSAALQWALNQIGSGLVVFTDDDVRVQPDWLEHYAAAAAEHGDHAFYGGPLRIDYQTAPPAWLIPYLPKSAIGWDLQPDDDLKTQPLFLGANYAAFVSGIQRAGGFNPQLGTGSEGNPVGEEQEIQRAMLGAGLAAVYVPQAPVWHWVPHDRCTPGWALRRTERMHVTWQLLREPPQGRHVLGAPVWMWQRLAKAAAGTAWAWMVRDPLQRFLIRRAYYEQLGQLRGARLAYHRHSKGSNQRG